MRSTTEVNCFSLSKELKSLKAILNKQLFNTQYPKCGVTQPTESFNAHNAQLQFSSTLPTEVHGFPKWALLQVPHLSRWRRREAPEIFQLLQKCMQTHFAAWKRVQWLEQKINHVIIYICNLSSKVDYITALWKRRGNKIKYQKCKDMTMRKIFYSFKL